MVQFKSSVGLRSSNSTGDSHADHGVVAGADQTHHLNMSRDGGGASELGITVHTAHGVGQTIGSGACSDVVGVQGTARAAAGSDGEVLLAHLDAFLLVGASDRMLEAGRVGGVAGDGDVDAFLVHDGNALADVVSAVAADVGALALGVADLADDLQLAGVVVELGLDIGEAVDTGDDLGGVLAKAVQDDAQVIEFYKKEL